MTTQQNTTLDTLADALAAALGELDPAGQRLAIALYRLLAAGRPVAAADLATATGLPEPAVAETIGSSLGHPVPARQTRAGGTGDLGLPGDRRADPADGHPGRRHRGLAPGGGHVVPEARRAV